MILRKGHMVSEISTWRKGKVAFTTRDYIVVDFPTRESNSNATVTERVLFHKKDGLLSRWYKRPPKPKEPIIDGKGQLGLELKNGR